MWTQENRSTSDALGVTQRTIELAERAGQKGLKIPLDWEKAFDRITQEWLFKALEDFAIPEESMGSIKSRYEKTPIPRKYTRGKVQKRQNRR